MKMVKSLLLGSAAGLAAMTAAHAADLPVKAKPVEYVRICSLYGPGFFYIPGTETCLKIGGYTLLDVPLGDSRPSHNQTFNGNMALNTRDNDYMQIRARANVSFDVRSQTAYGALRSFALIDINMTTSNANYNSTVTANTTNNILSNAFIQFAGFTLGKAVPVLRAPWHNTIWTTTTPFGYNDTSLALIGTLQAAYTAELGNGASITFGIEDATYGRQPLYDTVTAFTTPFATGWGSNSYGGQYVPDFVGNFRFEQAWGGAFLSAKVRNLDATYYAIPGAGGAAPATITQLNGNPRDVIAFTVNAGLQFKNLPTGTGDQLQFFASYGDGLAHGSGNAAPEPALMGITGRSTLAGAFQSLAYVPILDGVYNVALGRIVKTQTYGFQAGFEHYWIPSMLRSSVFGGYSRLDYNATANAALCTSAGRTVATGGQALAGSNCNFDATFWSVGTRTVWTPVRSLDLIAEFLYTRIDTNLSGTVSPAAAAFKPAATYQLRDQDVYSGMFRAIRVF